MKHGGKRNDMIWGALIGLFLSVAAVVGIDIGMWIH